MEPSNSLILLDLQTVNLIADMHACALFRVHKSYSAHAPPIRIKGLGYSAACKSVDIE